MQGEMPDSVGPKRRGPDRRRRRRWVWRERRGGFDRRREHTTRIGIAWEGALVYLRDNPLALLGLLAIANLLSLLDLAFTLWALDHGAVEANPVMRVLIQDDPALAMAAKIGMVAGVSIIIFLLRRHRLMLKVAVLALVLFAAIVFYHFYGAAFLL